MSIDHAQNLYLFPLYNVAPAETPAYTPPSVDSGDLTGHLELLPLCSQSKDVMVAFDAIPNSMHLFFLYLSDGEADLRHLYTGGEYLGVLRWPGLITFTEKNYTHYASDLDIDSRGSSLSAA